MLFSRDGAESILAHTKNVNFVRMDDPFYCGIVAQNASVHRYYAKALAEVRFFYN